MAGKPAEQFAVSDECAAQELQPRGFFMGCQRAPAALRYDNQTFAIASNKLLKAGPKCHTEH
jgi:hypothetical protein